jgi:hypothetical protein
MYVASYRFGIPKILVSPIGRTVVLVCGPDIGAVDPYDFFWKRAEILWAKRSKRRVKVDNIANTTSTSE